MGRKPDGPDSSDGDAIEIALAALAHEIRTPLTGILALSQLLQSSDLPKRQRGWADAIASAADHLSRLTTLVVDAAKAGSGRLALRDERFDPRVLAARVGGALKARAEAKGVAADIDIAASLPRWVLGDEVRLRSALENLVDNAVKFTEQGRIGFSARASKIRRDRVELSFVVKDSGIGMTKSDLTRLFQPFSQASADIGRRYGGAGLGLAFVKRIAEAMGGRLAVTSRPGRGSTFRLTALMKNAAPARHRRRADAPASKFHVLCVEDNAFGRLVLGTVLRQFCPRVSFVGSGEAAIKFVKRTVPDAVFMDIALPGLDGLEATRRIRALAEPAGSVPIIGISGRSALGDMESAKAAGMDAYLRKPATASELYDALLRVVRAKRGAKV